jgi:hypothetical protein
MRVPMKAAHGLCTLICVVLLAACGRVGYGSSRDASGSADTRVSEMDSSPAEDGSVVLVPDASVDAPSDAWAALDDAGACAESPCRVLSPQCGCAPGAGCAPEVDGTRVCSPRGVAGEGALCVTSADCAPGLNCGKFGGREPPGTCVRYCGSAADCASGGSCTQLSPPVAGLGLCALDCDPVAQTGCAAGTACFVFPVPSVPDGAAVLGSACSAPTGLAEGAICTRPRECAPGLTCADTGGELRCRPQCEVGGAPCVSGTCASYTTPLRHSGREYGVCL